MWCEDFMREMGSLAQRNALRRGEIDAAILYTLPDREFAHYELVTESLVVALAENDPPASRESLALKDLVNEVFVLPGVEVAEALYRAILVECAEDGFEPRFRMSLPLKQPWDLCLPVLESQFCRLQRATSCARA